MVAQSYVVCESKKLYQSMSVVIYERTTSQREQRHLFDFTTHAYSLAIDVGLGTSFHNV